MVNIQDQIPNKRKGITKRFTLIPDALKAITSLSAAIRFMVRRTDKRTDIGNTYTKKEGRLYKKTWAMVINGTLD